LAIDSVAITPITPSINPYGREAIGGIPSRWKNADRDSGFGM
jgi:hypothetical protein